MTRSLGKLPQMDREHRPASRLQGEGHSPRTSRSEGRGRFQLLPSRAVGLDQWGFCSQKHRRWGIGHQDTAGSHLLFQGQAMEQAEVWGRAPRSGLAGNYPVRGRSSLQDSLETSTVGARHAQPQKLPKESNRISPGFREAAALHKSVKRNLPPAHL